MPKGTGVYLGPGSLQPSSQHDPSATAGARGACERPTQQHSAADTTAAVHKRSTPLAGSGGLDVSPRAHSWSSGPQAAAAEAAAAAAAASGSSHTPLGWGGVPLMVQQPSHHKPASQHAPSQARHHRPAAVGHAGSSSGSSSSSSSQHLAAGRTATAAAGRGQSMAASRLAAGHPLYREAADVAGVASVASSSASSSASSLPRLPPDSVIARSVTSSWCSGPRSSDACGGHLPSGLIQLQDWDEQPALQAAQQQQQQLAQMPPMRQSSLTDSGSEFLVLSELQPAASPEPAVQQQQQLPGLARWSLQSASSDQPWQAAGGPSGGLHQPEPAGGAPMHHVLVRQSTNDLYSCPLPASLPFGGEDCSSAGFDDSSFLASVGLLLGGGPGDEEPAGLFSPGTGTSSGPLPAVVDVSCSATSLTAAGQSGWAAAAAPAAAEPPISTIVAGLQESFIQTNSSALDTSRYAVLHPGSTWSAALPAADQSAGALPGLQLHSLSTPLMPVASVQQQQQQQQQLLLQPHSPQQQRSWGQLQQMQQPETGQSNLQQLIDGRIEQLLMRRNELLGGASAAAIAAAVGSARGVGGGGAFLQRRSPQQSMAAESLPSLELEALLQQQQHGPGLRRISPAAAAAFEAAGARAAAAGPPASPSQQQLQQEQQLLLQALQQGALQLPGGADASAPGGHFR